MDIESINSETINMQFTACQFWEQEGPILRHSRNFAMLMVDFDSINETWKLCWLVLRSRVEFIAYKQLKKHKHCSSDFVWIGNSSLEKLMYPINEERNRKPAEEAALQLLKLPFLQHNTLLYNCDKIDQLRVVSDFEPFCRN